MQIRRLLSLTAGAVLVACGTAGAQEPGKTGITMAFPGAIGIIWHASDKVAVRPTFNFSRSSSEGTSTSSSSAWAFGTSISLLLYLRKYDNVRTYFSPRFTYGRNTSTVNVTLPAPITIPEQTNTSSSVGGGGMFGAQYSPSTRFSVFGEAGLTFSRQTSDSSSTVTRFKSNGFGTAAGVGVIFYP
jgi:hypothetical protein